MTNPESSIETYLRTIAGMVPDGLEAWVLRHGKHWPTDAASFDGPRGEMKQCYKNAAHLALERDDLTYVEGYTTVFGIPIAHAWCVTAAGVVVDPTIQGDAKSRVAGYFGVAFNTEYLRTVLLRSGTYGVIEFNDGLLTGREDGSWEAQP